MGLFVSCSRFLVSCSGRSCAAFYGPKGERRDSDFVCLGVARCLLLIKSERDPPKLDCAVHFDMRCMNGKGSGVT